MVEQNCMPLADNSESKVFFLKIIGDYYRYASESFVQSQRDSNHYKYFVENAK